MPIKNEPNIRKFFRLSPNALEERRDGNIDLVTGPASFIAATKVGYGIVLASWERSQQLGEATRLGVIMKMRPGAAEVIWAPSELRLRPNPAGRRFWQQAKPFFGFASDVAQRYMLAAIFAEHFPGLILPTARSSAEPDGVRPSNSPTGGYVYLVRSPYGVKIGKAVNVKNRTRLFEVKLPFPITVEHYAWFEDYSMAERSLHLQYHAKRLEGEWFDLSAADIADIKKLGKPVPLESL